MLYACPCLVCPPYRAAGKWRSLILHIGVGFCVARSDCMGNAKASKSGTATVQTPALFRMYAQLLILSPFRLGESAENNIADMNVCWYDYSFVRDRAQSWVQKAESCRGNELGNMMDCFIAHYIAYSAWVSLFNRRVGDKKRCIECVNCVLSENEELLQRLDGFARELGEGITSTPFDVRSSNRNDPRLSDVWGTSDGLFSLLATLYYMRCNLFHGSKDLIQEQMRIFAPAIECLKILNDALAQFFENEYNEYLDNLRQ